VLCCAVLCCAVLCPFCSSDLVCLLTCVPTLCAFCAGLCPFSPSDLVCLLTCVPPDLVCLLCCAVLCCAVLCCAVLCHFCSSDLVCQLLQRGSDPTAPADNGTYPLTAAAEMGFTEVIPELAHADRYRWGRTGSKHSGVWACAWVSTMRGVCEGGGEGGGGKSAEVGFTEVIPELACADS
jgi:hypothetical protein